MQSENSNRLTYRHLNNPVQSILKDTVSLLYLIQRKPMCDKRSSIYLTFFYQAENLGTIATIYSTCFKSQVLAIHIR